MVGSTGWGPEAAVAPQILASYVGSYEFTDGADRKVLEVSVANSHLKFFGTQLRAVSEAEFAGILGSIRFDRDSTGKPTGLTINTPLIAFTPKGVRVK